MHNLQNYAKIVYWKFTSRRRSVVQQLISDVLTCFGADLLPMWRQSRHIGAPLAAPMGAARGAL